MPPTRFNVATRAREEMLRQGFHPDFSEDIQEQLSSIQAAASPHIDANVRDLRNLLWSSIDNSSSKDLDQIEWAETTSEGIRLLVGIADVDVSVGAGTAIDAHASSEATSVYAPGVIFPMLPDQLSAGLTSLLPHQDRLATVIEMIVAADGDLNGISAYRALVSNRFQLVYGRIAAWLEGRAPSPADGSSPELNAQLQLQRQAAALLRQQRARLGALQFHRSEPVPVIVDGQIRGIEARGRNGATDIIEDLMIAANEAMARLLSQSGLPAIRRVVKSPERWPRIVQLAAGHGVQLPAQPSSSALASFLSVQQEKDPDAYADLSLAVLKLMGPGEYVVVSPGEPNAGHFGLATHDYTHSTAPNRRFADLVTQRSVKAALTGNPSPYDLQQLQTIAAHCTEREDAARKVERTLQKCVAAYALRVRVGQTFRAVITGVTPKGVFARVLDPPIEGRVMEGEKGLDVGDRVRLKLLRTDPERGFIDFAR